VRLSPAQQQQSSAIGPGSYHICVVGLGKIGLALAAQYASRGFPVEGSDINRDTIALVNQGQVPANSEEGLAERVRAGFEQGLLHATTETPAAMARSNVVVVIVPLLVDAGGTPDFRALDAAMSSIAGGLRPGTLVLLETTVPIGTTRNRLGPMLERSGLRMGASFELAFSPERVLVGRIFADLERYPKVVGGTTPEATRLAAMFYRTVLNAPVIEMQDAETAEFVKLAETTYRDVNIGLANDLARFAQARGIDAVSAFRAANTQPFARLHEPGLGVGGHCIPVYPQFLLHQATDTELAIVRAARRANNEMAGYAVQLLAERLGSLSDRRVLILGLAYRGGVKEASYSSARLIIADLLERRAVPLLNDPLFSEQELAETGAQPVKLHERVEVDAVMLQANHAEYRDLDWSQFLGCQVVVDGRNALDRRMVEAAGLDYIGIGSEASSRSFVD
jgi:nucleotide sugar dehydrogenase